MTKKGAYAYARYDKKKGAYAYARYDKRPPAVILSETKCSVRISGGGGEKEIAAPSMTARNDKGGMTLRVIVNACEAISV